MKEANDARITDVVSKCKECGAVDRFQIPTSGLEARAKGVLLKDAFLGLPEHRVRQLSENLCQRCQEGVH